MGIRRQVLDRIMQEQRDLSIEDMCRLFEAAAGDAPEVDRIAREAFHLIVADPAAARKVIAANPELAELEGLIDLIDRRARATRPH